MKKFEAIVEANTVELKNGKSSVYIEVLEDSIEQYQRKYGVIPESEYLKNYVKSCFRNDLAKKDGRDSFGRKQLMGYVKRWIRKVGLK
ncbi:hypothetical protein ETB66_10875 [Vibrio parahaemolyticus]|nr:hypothetical protein [Vibrio parahaemolyticus]